MLYVIYGTDTAKTRAKLTALVDNLLKKRPDANVFRMNPENWSETQLDEFVSGVNLFAPKNIVVLDSLVSNKSTEDAVLDRVDVFSSSEHVCILIEPKFTKEQLKKIEKKAEKIEEHNLSESSKIKREAPQTFALADALAEKNKKRAWSIFQKLVRDGVVAEEIHGVVWWQFKSLYLASLYSSAKDAGLNPYVYQKSKSALKNWSKEALEDMNERLVKMYHKAHRGEVVFLSELEVLCLE